MEQLEIDQTETNPADPRDWDLLPQGPRRNRPSITYRSGKAIAYAQAHAGSAPHDCGASLNNGSGSDCAHFIAHCLAAGGLRIEPRRKGAVVCKHGLAVETSDILAQLKAWSGRYANIRMIDLSDAQPGDIGFLQTDQPAHAFMISSAWNIFSNPFETPKVWSHGTKPGAFDLDAGFRQWMTAAYRLEDG